MRAADVLAFALEALSAQKLRSLLTTCAVVLGVFILVVSLALARGVQATAGREFRRNDQLRRIEVWPGQGSAKASMPAEALELPGEMSEAKRERLRQAAVRRWSWTHLRRTSSPLTREQVQSLAALDHVVSVSPLTHESCRLVFDGHSEDVLSFAAGPTNRHIRSRLVAGEFFRTEDERAVLVHEYLAYLWGFPGDEDVRQLVGRRVRLEYRTGARNPVLLLQLLGGGNASLSPEEGRVLRKTVQQLPAALAGLDLRPDERDTLRKLLGGLPSARSAQEDRPVVEELTIAGVYREWTKEDQLLIWGTEWLSRDADVLLPTGTAESLAVRAAGDARFGVVTVTVDREEHIQEVGDRIRELGLEAYSLAEIYERVQLNLTLLTFVTGFVAGVSLLVAAVGITNTMLMTVLERTREIGILKAVGARDRHVQLVFLAEGALIGIVGGCLGLLLGWLASFPGDRLARSLIEQQVQTELEGSLFVFPAWVVVGAPLFAGLLTMLAAVYPARRAARITPVAALRHE